MTTGIFLFYNKTFKIGLMTITIVCFNFHSIPLRCWEPFRCFCQRLMIKSMKHLGQINTSIKPSSAMQESHDYDTH